jgi:hypothetical protein
MPMLLGRLQRQSRRAFWASYEIECRYDLHDGLHRQLLQHDVLLMFRTALICCTALVFATSAALAQQKSIPRPRPLHTQIPKYDRDRIDADIWL